jgi:hypothetical protein
MTVAIATLCATSVAVSASAATPVLHPLHRTAVPYDEAGLKAGYNARALSGDGNTLMLSVGGGVDVYRRSATGWVSDGSIAIAPEVRGLGSAFGYSIALSADGRSALISDPAYGYEGVGSASDGPWGVVWVFARAASGWASTGRLTPTDHTSGQFGSSVSLSADGATALVMARYATSYSDGAAYLFRQVGGSWKQSSPRLVLGWSGALSGDGKTAVICSDQTCSAQDVSGPTWHGVGTWSITSPRTMHSCSATSISGDGAIAAFSDSVNCTSPSANVVSRTSAAWSASPAVLLGAGDVQLSYDGKLAVGAHSGTVYALRPGGWIAIGQLQPGSKPLKSGDYPLVYCDLIANDARRISCFGWEHLKSAIWDFDLAAPSAPVKKPKPKSPLCKKGQHSTKAHPCRKR